VFGVGLSRRVHRPLQLLVTFICISLVAVTALALVVSGPLATAVGEAIGLGDAAVTAWQFGRWPVMLLLVLLILHVLYYASPNAKVRKKWFSPGALLTLVVWIVARTSRCCSGWMEYDAEIERTAEMKQGVPGADEELKLPERERPSEKQRASTA
jgi:membrane protein